MKALSSLGFCDARGNDSARNWQGWIFNEEQTATLEQWAGQRAPISSANSPRRLIHQAPSELSLHSTLQRLHQSPVSCYYVPLAYTVCPFHPQTPILFLPSFAVFSLEGWVLRTKRNQTGRAQVTISPSSNIHKIFVWATQMSKQAMCLCEIINTSLSDETSTMH